MRYLRRKALDSKQIISCRRGSITCSREARAVQENVLESESEKELMQWTKHADPLQKLVLVFSDLHMQLHAFSVQLRGLDLMQLCRAGAQSIGRSRGPGLQPATLEHVGLTCPRPRQAFLKAELLVAEAADCRNIIEVRWADIQNALMVVSSRHKSLVGFVFSGLSDHVGPQHASAVEASWCSTGPERTKPRVFVGSFSRENEVCFGGHLAHHTPQSRVEASSRSQSTATGNQDTAQH